MRPPSAMAPLGPRASQWPCQSPLFLPCHSVNSQVGFPHRPGIPAARRRPWWDRFPPHPEHPWAGAVRRPYRRNKAWGGGGARAGLPPPQHGRVLPGPSDQDVARPGSSPAGTQGPGTGHQLPPVLRTRSPTAANTLVRGRTGKCALFSPAPQAWWVWTGAHGCPLSPVRI